MNSEFIFESIERSSTPNLWVTTVPFINKSIVERSLGYSEVCLLRNIWNGNSSSIIMVSSKFGGKIMRVDIFCQFVTHG
jgi:hypothetical protein